MKSYQKYIVVCNLTADATTKTLQSGTTAQSFRVAVNQQNDTSAFYNVECYGKDKLVPYLLKGTRVILEGELKQRSYEKDGKTFIVTEIFCTNINLLGNKSKEEDSTQEYEQGHHV
jgi:single-strand DNA-binding protein